MSQRLRACAPGLVVVIPGAAVAWLVHALVPSVPWLTAAFVLGFLLACVPPLRAPLDGPFAPGLRFSSRSLLRTGIVLLGLDLALGDVAALGVWGVLAVVALVGVAFVATYGLGRLFRLPGDEPLLLAAGFSICGVSAIGAMAAARPASASEKQDAATPTALVTLFGTVAIVLLPASATLAGTLGWRMTPEFFGAWAGASVHDVGQVVATAQTAGATALAAAIVVKLTRVLMLAPMVAIASLGARRQARASGASGVKLPPVVPLFIVGFLVLVLLRTFVPIPDAVVEAADLVRNALLAAALVAMGASLRIERLVRTGGRALGVASLSWLLILVLGAGVAWVVTT